MIRFKFAPLLCYSLSILLFGCGDGSSPSSETKTIGGNVSGLPAGSQLILLEKDQSLTITQNGTFTFPNPESIGSNYEVFIPEQPEGVACYLENQSGTVSNENNISISIACNPIQPSSSLPYANYQPPAGCGCRSSWSYGGKTFTGGVCATPDNDPNGPWCYTSSTCNGMNFAYCTVTSSVEPYRIGGKVSGLNTNSEITLQNNYSQTVTLNSNGNFSFSALQNVGSAYNVTILNKTQNEICSIQNGIGFVSGNVNSVAIDCGESDTASPLNDCQCMPSWSYGGSSFQGCANPDNDPNGSWCFTTSACRGNSWSYCRQ